MVAFLIVLNIKKKNAINDNIEEIAIRISINGISERSNVTKLITNILLQTGYRVIGKTAGPSAKITYWCEDEKSISEKAKGPSTSEQVELLQNAVDLEAEALVFESLAGNYKYKASDILDPNVVVIVDDFDDVESDKEAKLFEEVIPYDGYLIALPSPYSTYFGKVARERDTKMILAKDINVSSEIEKNISSKDISLAIAVGQVLGIDEETCLRTMLGSNL